MKRVFVILLCSALLLISGCTKKYQRISFDDAFLADNSIPHIEVETNVVNNTSVAFPNKLSIYEITERNIAYQDYEQMLESLKLSPHPKHFELDGNRLFYNLASYTDSSRGFFNMTDSKVETLAKEIFALIPFMYGEYECLGIRHTMTRENSQGTHITRVGVSFRKLLDDVRVVGEEECVLFFDGSGLVAIDITLFSYKKIGNMDVVDVSSALDKIKEPDDFSVDAKNIEHLGEAIEALEVNQTKLLFVNQYSRGCQILQPVYNFTGTAIDTNNNEMEFSAKVIAIPESYTYETE